MDIKAHFIREHVENGLVKLVFVRSEENVADGFTKSGSREEYLINFKYLRNVCHDNGLTWQGRVLRFGFIFLCLIFMNGYVECMINIFDTLVESGYVSSKLWILNIEVI